MQVAQGSEQAAALIEAFNQFARKSQHATMQGFMDAFRGNVSQFIEGVRARPELRNASILAFQSISYIYQHWVTHTKNIKSMQEMTSQMISLGGSLAANFRAAPRGVAANFRHVLRGDDRVVTFGYSALTRLALVEAAENGFPVFVSVLEGRPGSEGYELCGELHRARVECELVLDCHMAGALERADFVVVSADAVTENGGVVAAPGASTLALCARALDKPVYVLAENFKLSRIFALRHCDLPSDVRGEVQLTPPPGCSALPPQCNFTANVCDFIPPAQISFIITDGKILKPSSISDELFHMYHF